MRDDNNRTTVSGSLNEAFPPQGPCALYGSGVDTRHRVLDAIVERHAGGDSIESLSKDYNRPMEVIELVLQEWKTR